MNKQYQEFISIVKRVGTLSSIGELLGWDQEVMMPKGAIEVRAKEMGELSALQHELFTSKRMGELIELLENAVDLTEDEKVNLREVSKDYKRQKKVPVELVQKLTELGAKGSEVWRDAREKSEFSKFSPTLKELVELKKQYAKAIDPDKHPYEVLMYDYENGIPVEKIREFFSEIKEALIPLIAKIKESKQPDTSIIDIKVEEDKQYEFCSKIAKDIGYDFNKGRLDKSTHPFTACFGRITTRFNEGWASAIASTIHEAGHAMYEHGLLFEHFGTPLGEARSMSVHESQSRLWENHIGRSKEFWKYALPIVKKAYSPVLDNAEFEGFYKAMNKVDAGFIRVNADELTYTLHIIIRFEIESDLIEGKINVEDLPKIWNEKMQKYLGITPPNDKLGVLQDIHWSDGSFGYFPTYSLGTMIAAQLFEAAKKDISDLDDKIANGSFKELKKWLGEKIHSQGCRYSTLELIKKATGKGLSSEDYIKYLKDKFEEIYGL